MKQIEINRPIAAGPSLLEDETVALWRDVAAEIGWPARPVSMRSLKLDSSRSVAVVKVTGPDAKALVLKGEFGRFRPDRLARDLEALDRARTILAPFPDLAVPEIVWRDPARGVSIQSFVPGDSGRKALSWARFGLGDRSAILRWCGRYAAALHRGGMDQVGGFRPGRFLGGLSERAAKVRQGALAMPKPKRFLGLCAYLHRAGRRCRSAPAQLCRTHGDFHLLNLIVADDRLTAIDFRSRRQGYGYGDLARFWLNAGESFDPQDHEALGFAGLPLADLQALEEGYGHRAHENPVFVFLFAHQMYAEWSKLARTGGKLRPDQRQQLIRLTARLDALLAAEGSE
ncbi:aminoglycoside phosphotransferase family protein [Ruegeria jejuensis]|uniref:aminoglycoside phosphotransferase family protein n=1 Tax=Ruegeria jejuensis TaxID=3233338 RepID=UPI00355AEA2E